MMVFLKQIYALVLAEAEHQRKNFFLLVPIFFGLGIGIYFSLGSEPDIFLSVALSLILACIFTVMHITSLSSHWLKMIILSLLIGSLGFMAAQIRTISMSQPLIKASMGPVELDATINKVEYLPAGVRRIYLSDLDIERLSRAETPRQIRLHFRKNLQEMALGDRVKILAHLHPASGPVYPGGFDFQRYAYFHEIAAVGFVYKMLEHTPREFSGFSIEKLRNHIAERIFEVVPERDAGIIAALLVGHKRAINEDDLQAIRDAGLAHILAISGLHLGLVAGGMFFLSRFLMVMMPGWGLRYPIKKYAAVLAMIAGFFYMLLAGATIPTQRAFILTFFFFGAILYDRSPFSLRFLAFAALIVLIFTPESLLSPSFQMSFAAVTALIAFYDWFSPKIKSLSRHAGVIRKFLLYMGGVLITSIIASAATGLFSIYHFQHFSFLGIVSNMLVIPLLAFFVMPLGMLSLVLMLIGLDEPVLYLMGQGVHQIILLSHLFAEHPWTAFQMHFMPNPIFLIFLLGCFLSVFSAPRIKVLCVPVFLIGSMAYHFVSFPDLLLTHPMKQIGINQDQKLYVSNNRAEKFTTENWQGALGVQAENVYSWSSEPDFVRCDEIACRFELKDHKISVLNLPQQLDQECDWADVILLKSIVPRDLECSSRVIIDLGDTKKEQAYTIHLDASINIQGIQSGRGKRPWIF